MPVATNQGFGQIVSDRVSYESHFLGFLLLLMHHRCTCSRTRQRYLASHMPFQREECAAAGPAGEEHRNNQPTLDSMGREKSVDKPEHRVLHACNPTSYSCHECGRPMRPTTRPIEHAKNEVYAEGTQNTNSNSTVQSNPVPSPGGKAGAHKLPAFFLFRLPFPPTNSSESHTYVARN